MAYLDAFEWFYHHSRRYETYDYDEFMFFLTLFLIMGMLWVAFVFYQKAICEIGKDSNTGKKITQITEPSLSRPQEKRVDPLAKPALSPLFLTSSLILIIGGVEALDMLFIHNLSSIPYHLETLFDTVFLIVMIIPAIYFTFFRPLYHQIIYREQAENKLKQLNLDLEKRINQRTAQLQNELEERKRKEEIIFENQKQLRSLATQLSMAEERERNRLAMELHDNIGHTMAIANNRLGMLKKSIPAELESEILDIKNLITETIRYSRSLSSELTAPMINDLPFVSVLEILAEDILNSSGINYNLMETGSPELRDTDSRVIVTKAVKEILVNIVKHAKAHNVEIYVGAEDGGLIIRITDDGTGFDVSEALKIKPTRKLGIGLFNIHEQLTNLEGSFSVSSTPGSGTTVTMSIALTEEKRVERDEI